MLKTDDLAEKTKKIYHIIAQLKSEIYFCAILSYQFAKMAETN